MKTKNDNNNAFLIHISALAGYFFPLGGVIAPLIFWQVKKDESAFLDEQGKEAVNFNLSFLLYQFILGLTFIPFFFRTIFNAFSNIDNMHNNFHFDFPNIFGFFGSASLIGLLAIARLALIILGAIRANNGENYKYPLTIKFIK
ncbi:DUF4870 domain-containing protein [Urechidicola croceus]|uniref:DUF4870 domain-containing protein n=1 Tax=Urechidicola croceus TaxID=1850246 RepID=A0A1D8PB95_9FLAO|nr:DUF4870 domain-containing protein [Urechidicola croceus]AOW21837.1 hypothetical protein LPB138_14600 [Urechidicola croceus]